jgi:hypothetical protein
VTPEERIEEAQDVGKPGRPTREAQADNHVVNRVIEYGSTNADYLAARIKRDHPEIAERMKAGEYASVRKAGIDAGIVKPRISIPTEPNGAARLIRRHFTPDQIAQRIAALGAVSSITRWPAHVRIAEPCATVYTYLSILATVPATTARSPWCDRARCVAL